MATQEETPFVVETVAIPELDISEEQKNEVAEIVRTRLTPAYLAEHRICNDTIHRFCTARLYDPDASTSMLSEYIKWRAEFGVDTFTLDHPLVQKEASTRKAYFLGYAKNKTPLILVHGGGHDPEWSPVDDVKVYALYMLETAIKHMPPGVSKVTLISDYSSFGYANLDNSLLQEGARLLQNYYPERVGDVYIVNYPFIMWGIWKIVSPWVDDKTRNKFHFCASDEELLTIADASVLPDFLGGTMADHMPEDNLSGIQRLANPPL